MTNSEMVARSLAAIWHPCTQMKQHARFPLVPIAHAQGPWLHDFDGRRYLSPETFADMTTDHIGKDSGIARDYLYFPGDGFGFGYGFGVRTEAGNARPPPPGSLGEIKWDGASGCYFIIDRKQDFFLVLLQQTPSTQKPDWHS